MAGVDYVGVSNLFTFLESMPPYWKPMLDMLYEMIGDPRTEGKQALHDASPLFFVDRIVRTPLLCCARRRRSASQTGRKRSDRRSIAGPWCGCQIHPQGKRRARFSQRREDMPSSMRRWTRSLPSIWAEPRRSERICSGTTTASPQHRGARTADRGRRGAVLLGAGTGRANARPRQRDRHHASSSLPLLPTSRR